MNPGWVGTLIGIVSFFASIGFGYYFYRKSERRAVPTAILTTYPLVGQVEHAIEGLDVAVSYHGKRVPRATSTTIRFWNDGNATLDGAAVTRTEPLRLELPVGTEILAASIVALPRPVNNVQVTIAHERPNCAEISFDYFEPNDGVLIECVHTGDSKQAQLKGVIKGVPDGIVVKNLSRYEVLTVSVQPPITIGQIGSLIGLIGIGTVLWRADYRALAWAVLGWVTAGVLTLLIKKKTPFPKSLLVPNRPDS